MPETPFRPNWRPRSRYVAVAGLTLLCAVEVSAQQPRQPAPSTAPQAKAALPAASEAGPVGTWIDHTGRGAVAIAPCGTELCGRIIWLKDPNDKQGRPLRDGNNPDRAQRMRAICGLPIIGGLKRQRDGSWDEGWIYDPEQGERFDVEIRLSGSDGLQVKGYKGFKFLSETFQWRRATAPLQPACPST